MKAISLWQPWASLWLSTAKVHETRHWPTSHRGYLLVHAAKQPISRRTLPAALWGVCDEQFGRDFMKDLPFGALIGRVDILDCVSTNTHQPIDAVDRVCGDFNANRFMWKRGRFDVFDSPIPYVGRQGFFDVTDEFMMSLLK